MTITLHWWLIPIVLVVIGCVALFGARARGDYDFVTPILATMIFLGCIFAAGTMLLGHWLR